MKDKTGLNEEQLRAVTYGEGPLLIIAGAGSGKTTVITERVKHLIIDRNVPPSQILALTFTEKSAREMEDRVDVALPYGYTQMWISTFHAFCDRVLRLEALHIGLNPSYSLSTEAEMLQLLKKSLFKFDLDYFRPLGNPTKFLHGLLQHFSRLKDEDVDPSEYLQYAYTFNKRVRKSSPDQDRLEAQKIVELAHAYKTYEDLKAKEGVLDFSDLITQTLRLFRTRKNVLKTYHEQFPYILIDEFQDTNFAQNTLAMLLAGDKKNITVVGDDDQAIYRWRGAAISNMIQFTEHFPDTKIITLTKNYRSTREILKKSYNLIQYNNPDRLETKQGINKKLVSARNMKGKDVELLYTDRIENEADLAANKIQELINSGNYAYKDVAILVRANDYSQSFIRAFVRHAIPFQFLGPGRLFWQEEIKDLIAYLKVLYNFEDSSSLYRILAMPLFNLDARNIAALLNIARKRNQTLFETLEYVTETQETLFFKEGVTGQLKKIVSMIKNHLKSVPKETAGQILYYFLEDTGWLKNMLAAKTVIDEKKSQNVARFFDKLKTYETEHEDASVFAVVDWIDLSMQMGESPLATDTDWAENNAVNILTIHASKGLEFSVVFIVNLVSQRFPSRERREQIPIPDALIKEILPEGDSHLQEERRLFYVAMTRARDILYMTASRYYGEGKRERKLSPFVYEALGEKIVENYIELQKQKTGIFQPSLLEWSTKHIEIVPAKAPANDMLDVTYLSYSQMQTFDICPLHYKLRYVLKIPTPQTAAQSFGVSVHSALRDYYYAVMRKEKVSIENVEAYLKKVWVSEGYTSKEHEKTAFAKAQKLVTEFLVHNLKSQTIPLALELPFQFFIKHPGGKNGVIKLGGRIDRIDKVDKNRIEILDYKTGSNIPSEKELRDNMQLTFYALAATHVQDKLLNKKPDEVLLSLYYLEEGRKLTTTRTKEQLEEAKEKIVQIAETIARSTFLCSGSALCRECEYKMLCSTNA